MTNWMRVVLASAATVACLALVNPSALASPPVLKTVDATSTEVITDLCSFPVTVRSTLVGWEKNYFDKAGNLVMIVGHGTFTDTFSANGVTLQGDPYRSNARATLDSNGNFISLTGMGVTERVPLPDGQVFFSAGRIDFLAHTDAVNIVPDTGRSGDVAALCRALSG
jgi:hypothetical protein